MSTLAEIEAVVDLLQMEQKRELLLFLAARLGTDQQSNHSPGHPGIESEAGIDDAEYERGYGQIPEDISLTTNLLPYLAADLGNWE